MAVEAAAYFTVCEALTNVARYAAGEPRLGQRRGARRAPRRRRSATTASAARTSSAGSGLQGLRDRVAAVSGTLEIDSPPGSGTLLRARLPAR